MGSRDNWWIAMAAIAIAVLGDTASAQDVEKFYAGRKLQVVIGHEVGTGFDLYGRALARQGRFEVQRQLLVEVVGSIVGDLGCWLAPQGRAAVDGLFFFFFLFILNLSLRFIVG